MTFSQICNQSWAPWAAPPLPTVCGGQHVQDGSGQDLRWLPGRKKREPQGSAGNWSRFPSPFCADAGDSQDDRSVGRETDSASSWEAQGTSHGGKILIVSVLETASSKQVLAQFLESPDCFCWKSEKHHPTPVQTSSLWLSPHSAPSFLVPLRKS